MPYDITRQCSFRDRETVWGMEIDRPRYIYARVMSFLFGRLQNPVDPRVEKLISSQAAHDRIWATWLTWIVEAVERTDKRGILNGSPFPPNRLIVRYTYIMQIKRWDRIEWGRCWCIAGKSMARTLSLILLIKYVFKIVNCLSERGEREGEWEGERFLQWEMTG